MPQGLLSSLDGGEPFIDQQPHCDLLVEDVLANMMEMPEVQSSELKADSAPTM